MKITMRYEVGSGHIPPTSGQSDWLNRDPHMVYRRQEMGQGQEMGLAPRAP